MERGVLYRGLLRVIGSNEVLILSLFLFFPKLSYNPVLCRDLVVIHFVSGERKDGTSEGRGRTEHLWVRRVPRKSVHRILFFPKQPLFFFFGGLATCLVEFLIFLQHLDCHF